MRKKIYFLNLAALLTIVFLLATIILKSCRNRKNAGIKNISSFDTAGQIQTNHESIVLLDRLKDLRCSCTEVGVAEDVHYKIKMREKITDNFFADIKQVLNFDINPFDKNELLFEEYYLENFKRNIVLDISKGYTDERVLEYVIDDYYGIKKTTPRLSEKQNILNLLKRLEILKFSRQGAEIIFLSRTELNNTLNIRWRITCGFLDSEDYKTIFYQCKVQGESYWLPVEHNLESIE